MILSAGSADQARAQSYRMDHDLVGDAEVRRADVGADDPVDASIHRLPDIVSVRIGPWVPANPSIDLFAGQFAPTRQFFRLDIIFDGLVNPPGPLGCCGLPFAPFMYGDHPVFGYVEIDMDANVNTGGELDWPQFRYLGNAARFGGVPSDPRCRDRVARDGKAFDGNIVTAPLVDRSGEEFHLALDGYEIEEIVASDGTDAVFGPGETWVVKGYLFQRAHGYRDFSYACCLGLPGSYEPRVSLQFAHIPAADRTVVSLVYPLTNEGSAVQAATDVVEPPDGDPGNQNSVLEALDDLVFSVHNAMPDWLNDPNFAIIEEWGQFDDWPDANDVQQFLDPLAWQVTVLVGTSYIARANDAEVVWTDMMPNVVAGDFNGDGQVTWVDLMLLNKFVIANDGRPEFDADGRGENCAVRIVNFGPNFSVFDLDYNGTVDGGDRPVLPAASPVPGDLDHDRDVDQSDFGLLQACLGGAATVPSSNSCEHADLNLDHAVDEEDLAIFRACSSGPAVGADPMCWESGALRCSVDPSGWVGD